MVPVTIATGINAWIVENEHLSHGPPPYIPYDHLIRVSTSVNLDSTLLSCWLFCVS